MAMVSMISGMKGAVGIMEKVRSIAMRMFMTETRA